MLNGGLVDSVLIAAANNAQIENIERYLPREGFIMWIDSHEVEGTVLMSITRSIPNHEPLVRFLEPPQRSELLYIKNNTASDSEQDVNRTAIINQKRKGPLSEATVDGSELAKMQKSSDTPKSTLNSQAPPFFIVKQVYK